MLKQDLKVNWLPLDLQWTFSQKALLFVHWLA